MKDSNGVEIKIGNKIKEYNVIKKTGYVFDLAIGVVKYEKACHILDFMELNNGRLGKYTFYDRCPKNSENSPIKRVWEIVE